MIQFPICLAYAWTIHKVQGRTLQNVVVGNLDGFWQPELLYVAISRVRNENNILFMPSKNTDTPYYTYEQIYNLFNNQQRFDNAN